MATLKCKMCGGDIIVVEGSSVLECEHCGVMQTVPNVSDEKKGRLFDRANLFRRNSDFDKATILYEDIIGEYPEEAEGYWGLVLCKYGIEYVDDVHTGRKIPTCHRTLTTPIEQDADYLAAIEHATTMARDTYIAEAREIDRIQKQILSIALREEPYDIFICYKETDEFGLRTDDSGMAQDIYTELIREGYKVFFSRITLKGKSGTEYEPYIYSALSSARVMLVIGTCYEYFEAVWVKNEWSRFLSMMDGDSPKKTLIPCIKGIAADELPPRLKNLQALTISDVTFFKNLMESIRRAIPERSVKENAARASSPDSIAPLLKRASIFLSDGDFSNASAYCEKVLDIDPENSSAYLYKFMAEKKLRAEDDIKKELGELLEYGAFSHAYTYARGEQKTRLDTYIEAARENLRRQNEENEAARQKWICDGIDRAAELVAAGDFAHALESVRPALEDKTAHARAYLISLLARNKCRSERELVTRGVTISSDEDYLALIERSGGESRAYYEEMCGLCEIGHIFSFAHSLEQDNSDSAQTSLSAYSDAFGEDEVATCASRLALYDTDLRGMIALSLWFGEVIKKKAKESAERCTDCRDALFEAAIGASHKMYRKLTTATLAVITQGKYYVADLQAGTVEADMSKIEDEWADPASFREGLGGVDISADGQGAFPSERYLCLARKLYKAKGASATERIDRLVSKAVSMCPAEHIERIEAERTKLYIEMANSDKASREAIEHISDLDPDNAPLAWACAEKISVGFTKSISMRFDSDGAYDSLLAQKKRTLKPRLVLFKLESLRAQLASLVDEQTERKNAVKRMAERAIEKSSDKSAEYKNKYDEYVAMVDADAQKQKAILGERIAAVEKLYKYAHGKAKRSLIYHTVKKTLISAIALSVAAYMLIVALGYFNDPTAVLEYNGILFIAASILLPFIIGRILLRTMTRAARKALVKLCRANDATFTRRRHKTYGFFGYNSGKDNLVDYNECVVTRIIHMVAGGLVIAATLATVGLYAALPFTMADKIGEVPVSDVDSFMKIKSYPNLSYKLEEDIDLDDAKIGIIPLFFGALDGDGHKITGLNIQDEALIWFNRGTIKNIVIEDAWLEQELVGSNYGELSEITLQGSTLRSALVAKNCATLTRITVSGSALTPRYVSPDDLAFVCIENKADGAISECSVLSCSIVGQNELDYDKIYESSKNENTIKPPLSVTPDTIETPASDKTTDTAPDTTLPALSDTQAVSDTQEVEEKYKKYAREKEYYKDKLETTDISSHDADNIGGICALNYGSIRSCRVEELYSRAIVVGNFGGICAINEGSVIDVYTQGDVTGYITYGYETSTRNLGGIVGIQKGKINYAASELEILFDSYQTHFNVNLAGIAATVESGEITCSSYSGSILYRSSVYNEREYDTATNVAGIAGRVLSSDDRVLISDCYSEGKIAMGLIRDENTDYDKYPQDIRRQLALGAIAASTNDAIIEKCYSSATLAMFEDGGVKCNGEYCIIGAITASELDLLSINRNSYFIGKVICADNIGVRFNLASTYAAHCFYVDEITLPVIGEDTAKLSEKSREELTTADFALKTLGWSEEVWDFTADAPRLREYVPETSEDKSETTDTAASADSDTAADTTGESTASPAQ